MTKEEFRFFISSLVDLNMIGSGESDLDVADDVRAFDPQLAAMIQTIGETKRAIHKHIEKKRER